MKIKQVGLLGLVAILLGGCTANNAKAEELAKIPLVDALSKKEVVDYYAEEIKIKSITVKKPLQNREEVIEFRDIMDDEWPYVERELMRVEKLLEPEEYNMDEYLTPQMHAYMKVLLDDKTLTRESIDFKGATQEFFVVDVLYDVGFKGEGSLKDEAKYIGVHGVFIEDIYGNSLIDEIYVGKIEEAVQKQIDEQKLMANNGKISISSIQSRYKGREDILDMPVATPEPTPTPPPIENPEEPEIENEETEAPENIEIPEVQQEVPKKAYIQDVEDLNISVYNNILGSSVGVTSTVPQLDLIFTPSASVGNLNGYGIYAQGSTELQNFGISRENLSGKAIIRFVFRSELGDAQKVHIDNVYLKTLTIDGLPDLTSEKSIFPQFAEEAIKIQIDNADRARINNDITALAGGTIYDDVRAAIYHGFLNNNVDISRSISEVTDFLKRNDTDWLVEVKTYQSEHSKYSQAGYGIWQDNYLVSLKQKGNSFVISDYLLTKRDMLSDIPMRYANSVDKRFTYLLLSGTISVEDKDSIREFYNNFISFVDQRKWENIYASFNSDPSMLSKTRKDYLYYMYRGYLTRRGTTQTTEYHGAITEWLGGSSSQAEFMTMEITNYKELSKAQLVTSYILASKFEDTWVIDEIKVLETKDLEGAEITEKIQEIKLYGEGGYKGKVDASIDKTTEAP